MAKKLNNIGIDGIDSAISESKVCDRSEMILNKTAGKNEINKFDLVSGKR
jgi:hypothetical protein